MQISDPPCAVLRLTVRAHLERAGFHIDRFDAYIGDELIVTSRQPLLDGARWLLERGFDPGALLTMRMHNRPYDSFHPKPIREWAKWTIAERDHGGLHRERWKPLRSAVSSFAVTARSADNGLVIGLGSLEDRAPIFEATSDGRSGMPTVGLRCGSPRSNADKRHRQARMKSFAEKS